VPVLVLRGECGYKRWEITREYREVFGADLVYFPDAGHAIEFDQPELYVDTVVGFLTGAGMPLPLYTGEADPAL
jgi:pimeloyl-ACP methyl ester carboxylesterase